MSLRKLLVVFLPALVAVPVSLDYKADTDFARWREQIFLANPDGSMQRPAMSGFQAPTLTPIHRDLPETLVCNTKAAPKNDCVMAAVWARLCNSILGEMRRP
jgi:hypothetical protein